MKSPFFAATTLIVGSFLLPLCHAESTESGVRSAARSYLRDLERKIPTGYEHRYGLRDKEELKIATLGTPVRMAELDETALFDDGDLRVYALDLWRVPLVVHGENRALVTVVKQGRRYRAVAFGGAGLARRMQQLRASTGAGDTANTLLRFSRTANDFLIRASTGAELEAGRFYSLRDRRDRGSATHQPFGMTAAELVALLKPNIESRR